MRPGTATCEARVDKDAIERGEVSDLAETVAEAVAGAKTRLGTTDIVLFAAEVDWLTAKLVLLFRAREDA